MPIEPISTRLILSQNLGLTARSIECFPAELLRHCDIWWRSCYPKDADSSISSSFARWEYTKSGRDKPVDCPERSKMATDIRTSDLKSPVDLADYLFRRLHEVGIRSIHGVPGDYNLVRRPSML